MTWLTWQIFEYETLRATCFILTFSNKLSIYNSCNSKSVNHISDHDFKCLLESVISTDKSQCVAKFHFASASRCGDFPPNFVDNQQLAWRISYVKGFWGHDSAQKFSEKIIVFFCPRPILKADLTGNPKWKYNCAKLEFWTQWHQILRIKEGYRCFAQNKLWKFTPIFDKNIQILGYARHNNYAHGMSHFLLFFDSLSHLCSIAKQDFQGRPDSFICSGSKLAFFPSWYAQRKLFVSCGAPLWYIWLQNRSIHQLRHRFLHSYKFYFLINTHYSQT